MFRRPHDQQPEKLSEQIGDLVEFFNTTEALSGPQVGDVVVFLKQLLPDLREFAKDMEQAEQQRVTAVEIGLMAAAAQRLVMRLNAPRQTIAADLAPRRLVALLDAGANVVDLDRYRRPHRDGDAA
jgi:hypothetical protein